MRQDVKTPRRYDSPHRREQAAATRRIEEGAIVMRPKKLIDADQAWFWTEEWQCGEREASDDIAAGRTRRSRSADEFIESLG